jgi:3-oxoacid CoA-transferase A subunit
VPVNKVFKSPADALSDIFDGAVIMIGGFGSFGGLPINLITALARQGAKDLTIIANAGGVGYELSKRIKPEGYNDIGILFENGQAKKFIGSMPALGGMPPTAPIERAYTEGKIEIEMVPQGTLAERIRCGAGGIGGFYTRVGIGTIVENGKEKKTINDQEYILELPLTADFSLNHLMAMAARITIVEVDELVKPGELDPEVIITPHVYVDRIVEA